MLRRYFLVFLNSAISQAFQIHTNLFEHFEIFLSPIAGISSKLTVLSRMADNQRSKLSQQKSARKIAGVILQFAVVLIWEEKGRSTSSV